jgi:hypothetical protein
MKDDEKRAILSQHFAKFRNWNYEELVARIPTDGHLETIEECAPDGTQYSISFDVLWDDKKSGNVRVIGDLSTNRPLLGFIPIFFSDVCDSFIMSRDGRFVGEEIPPAS